jgi:hypothetical protein
MSPRRPCIELVDGRPCGQPCEGNRCPKHKREENDRRMARLHARGGDTPEWLAVSRARRAMAGRCELQVDDRCTGRPETAHLNPAREGEHRGATIDDVRAACRHCHGVVDAARSQDERRFRR